MNRLLEKIGVDRLKQAVKRLPEYFERLKGLLKRAGAYLASHKKVAVLAAFGVALLAALGWAAGSMFSKSDVVYQQSPVLVEVTQVELTGNDSFLTYAGIVQPEVLEQVTPSTIATIEEVLVEEGQAVSAGQELVRLDTSGAEQLVSSTGRVADSAKTARDNAATALERAKQNYNAACTPATEEQKAQAEAELRDAESRRDDKQAECDRFSTQYDSDNSKATALEQQLELVEDYNSKKQAYLSAPETTEGEQEAKYGRLEDGSIGSADNCTPGSLCGRYKSAAGALVPAYYSSEQQIPSDTAALQAQSSEARAAANCTPGSLCGQYKSAAGALVPAYYSSEQQIPSDTSSLEAQSSEARAAANQSYLVLSQSRAELATLEAEVIADRANYEQVIAMGSGSMDASTALRELEAAQTVYDEAQTAYDEALSNYQQAQEALDRYTLRSSQDGYVVMVVSTEGSTASPIAPVVVVGSERSVVAFGISQNDARLVKKGMAVSVTIDGSEMEGYVLSVSTMPDETSRTYETQVYIDVPWEDVMLGETASVSINVGERSGVWLPISVILNDGEDYVFVVVDGRAQRRNVTIEDLSNDYVLVSGLAEGDQVVTEGMSLIRAGSLVETAG